ncbi:MAG: AmmeMemoRadiSam system protein B [Candidatus Eisenbacteria bacterium]|nr:AmmeMemoRadiSam system protein B [Candidatus Eisenbacteria bacterium]
MPDEGNEKPRLRPVEAIPTTFQGHRAVLLRDPEGYTDRTAVLAEKTIEIIRLFDGTRTLLDIQADYTRRHGDILFTDDLKRLVDQLDEAGFLDNQRFRARREETEREWRESSLRPAVHLGGVAGEAEEWERWTDGFLGSAGEPETAPPAGIVRAIVAPHIDLRLGGGVYGAAWRAAVGTGDPPALIVVIGTCHGALPSLAAATTKDFETPLGAAVTDGGFLRAVNDAAGGWLFDEEPAHRTEHTVEFQCLFVRRLFGDAGTRIAPLLCSYEPDHLGDDAPEETRGRIERLGGALRAAIEGYDGRVLVVASADLSHVGPRYGHDRAPTEPELADLDIHDRKLLAPALAGDPAAFADRFAAGLNTTHVCGFAPIHLTLLALGEGARGSLLRYDRAVMGEEGSVVTFAAAAFA